MRFQRIASADPLLVFKLTAASLKDVMGSLPQNNPLLEPVKVGPWDLVHRIVYGERCPLHSMVLSEGVLPS